MVEAVQAQAVVAHKCQEAGSREVQVCHGRLAGCHCHWTPWQNSTILLYQTCTILLYQTCTILLYQTCTAQSTELQQPTDECGRCTLYSAPYHYTQHKYAVGSTALYQPILHNSGVPSAALYQPTGPVKSQTGTQECTRNNRSATTLKRT